MASCIIKLSLEVNSLKEKKCRLWMFVNLHMLEHMIVLGGSIWFYCLTFIDVLDNIIVCIQ